jgi:hypothetical protein
MKSPIRTGRVIVEVSQDDVEWYSGRARYSRPLKVKVKGVWHEVFGYEKSVQEEVSSRQRVTVFLCHIGDNQIVKVRVIGT